MGFITRYGNAKCPICRTNKLRIKGSRKDGSVKYGNTCNKCHKEKYKEFYDTYKANKHQKINCEICGFVPVDDYQLELHHIDGNHYNNSDGNIQIVCANCHKLLSKQQLIERLKKRI